MSSIVVKQKNGSSLIPFYVTFILYFVLYGDGARPLTAIYCIVKCAPIISLIHYVARHTPDSPPDSNSYTRKILAGLMFSCVGDFFMVDYDGHFLHGVAAFAVAQLLYSSAFGLDGIGTLKFGVGSSVLTAIVRPFVFPDLQAPILYFLLIYNALICTMAWCAFVRTKMSEGLWTWPKLYAFAGAIIFVLSDLTIVFDRFRSPVPYAQTIIMATYYIAQFGIALSIVES